MANAGWSWGEGGEAEGAPGGAAGGVGVGAVAGASSSIVLGDTGVDVTVRRSLAYFDVC
jgi:hypothetical protein